jgi:outer membrane protein TolC
VPAPPTVPTAQQAAQTVAVEAPPSELELLPRINEAQGGLTALGIAKRIVAVSPRSKSAKAVQVHAQERADRAKYLFLPRVDLSASYMRLSNVPIPPAPPGQPNYFLNLPNVWTARATMRIPVSEYFLGLADRYESAQHLEAFSKLQRQAEQNDLVYEVTSTYYDLARAIANRRLSTHRVAQLEKFVAEIDVLVQGGELGTVDLAQAKARLSGARAAEHRAKATQKVTEDALRVLLHIPPDAPVGVADDLLATIPVPPEGIEPLVLAALRDRPEARALQALITANEHTRDAVAHARYPTLSILGDVTFANPNQRYVPPEAEFNTTWAVGVELAWSPTELATQNQNLSDRALEVVRARQDLESLRGRIAIDVVTAYENAHAANGAIETSRAAVESADETYRVRNALFRAGEGTSRQVLDAEIDLRTAQLQWVDDVLGAHLARAALQRAIGSTSE